MYPKGLKYVALFPVASDAKTNEATAAQRELIRDLLATAKRLGTSAASILTAAAALPSPNPSSAPAPASASMPGKKTSAPPPPTTIAGVAAPAAAVTTTLAAAALRFQSLAATFVTSGTVVSDDDDDDEGDAYGANNKTSRQVAHAASSDEEEDAEESGVCWMLCVFCHPCFRMETGHGWQWRRRRGEALFFVSPFFCFDFFLECCRYCSFLTG